MEEAGWAHGGGGHGATYGSSGEASSSTEGWTQQDHVAADSEKHTEEEVEERSLFQFFQDGMEVTTSAATMTTEETAQGSVAESGWEQAGVVEEERQQPTCLWDFASPEAAAAITVLYQAADAFRTTSSSLTGNNFLKQIKWSPDGTCLLASSEDNHIRVFELPSTNVEANGSHELGAPALDINAGETVFDVAWYPHMNSYGMDVTEPLTCCFASTSRDHPIHLWDAFTGKSRCTYRAYDHADELTAANSVCFNLTGDKLFCGFQDAVRVFDISNPGRKCDTFNTRKMNHRGILSCFAFNPDWSGMLAIGSYSKVTGLYSYDGFGGRLQRIALLKGQQQGGVTQVMFSPVHGSLLFTGGRKDPHILVWDVRHTQNVLFRMERVVENNQRISFDVDQSGRYLITGSQDGRILVYDIENGGSLAAQLLGHEDVVNGACFHPTLPLIASSSGGRKYCLPHDEEGNMDEDDADAPPQAPQNVVWIWKAQHSSSNAEPTNE